MTFLRHGNNVLPLRRNCIDSATTVRSYFHIRPVQSDVMEVQEMHECIYHDRELVELTDSMNKVAIQ